MIHIGVDPGVRTGFAIWNSDTKKFEEIETLYIWEFFERIRALVSEQDTYDVTIYIEDARMRGGSIARAQGAGWVKTLSGQYQKYCESLGFHVLMISPKNTKWTSQSFKAITKWTARTSNHARDAAVMVFGKF